MVELKKALCILIAVAGVFVFAGIAGAQTCLPDDNQFDKCRQLDCCAQTGFPNVCDIGDPNSPYNSKGCETSSGCPVICNKCVIQNIPCQGEIAGFQGATEKTPTCRFDYDEPYGYCGPNDEFDVYGIATIDPNVPGRTVRNCRFFINICECQDACEIVAGKKVGLQMVLKVDGRDATLTDGVYWAQDPNLVANGGQIHFQAYHVNTDAELRAISCDPKKISDEAKDGERFFGNVLYYSGLTLQGTKGTDQGKGRAIYSVGNVVQPYSNPCVTGQIPAINRTTVLEAAEDYTISAEDVAGNFCVWMIDIPAVIIDSQAVKGTKISVEVRLLWNKEADKLCEGCEVADVCKCVRDIAIVCCDTKANNVGCLFFPYVLQGLKDLPENQSGGWVSGVAISAVPVAANIALTLPKGAYCTLTLRDTEGNTATFKNFDPGAGKGGLVWAFVLDSILPKFEGGPLKPGACSLMVETNYPIDGYTFMNANMQFGAGTLPRGCYGAVAP